MTIYLKFDTQEQAIDTLQQHGFIMSEYDVMQVQIDDALAIEELKEALA